MLRFTFFISLVLLLFAIAITLSITLYILPDLPDSETLKDVKMQIPLRIYTHDQALISEYGEKRRTPVIIEEVPSQLINAFLAAEDDRFFEHPGVDWHGILRATVNLVRTGEKTQGGSTITMQVARNFFLSREKSYLRKINEIFLALKIERELSKDEILELYLNKIYLGQRSYGVGAAAQVYYGKNIDNLNLQQLAMIAGLPKAPSTTNPISNPERAINRRNYVLQRMLIKKFITQEEYDIAVASEITASLHSPAIEIEAPYVGEMVRTFLVEKYGENAYSDGYKVFTTIVDKNQIAANNASHKALLEYDRRHGYRGPEHHFDLPDNADKETWRSLLGTFNTIGGLQPALIIEVTEQTARAYMLDDNEIILEWDTFEWARKYINENQRGPALKKAADIFQTGDIIRVIKNNNGEWKFAQIPEVEGGIVSMRSSDGAVLALTGGFDFQHSKFNRITQALRQPGSSFKPFIYSAALENGFTAASIINDAPVVFDEPGIEDSWRPENYSGRYYGPTRLREALIHSRNLVSIRVLHRIGVTNALKHIAKFGFDTSRLPHNLSLALGSGAVTPWQLASSYCVFANGGFQVTPYFIDRIETYDGEILYAAEPFVACDNCETVAVENRIVNELSPSASNHVPEISEETAESENSGDDESTMSYAERTINPQNIWIMNSMTQDVIQHGTGRKARILKRNDLSGKTGTTNDQRDAWFAGYNSELVTVTWTGFDNFNQLGNGETGARAALPMWIEYMSIALEDVPESFLIRPDGLVNVRIDPDTGKLAKADNPKAIFEVFKSGQVPTQTEDKGTRNIFVGENPSDHIPEQLF